MNSKIGEITLENELLRERARPADAGHPIETADVRAVTIRSELIRTGSNSRVPASSPSTRWPLGAARG
jgi:hypothetical protein